MVDNASNNMMFLTELAWADKLPIGSPQTEILDQKFVGFVGQRPENLVFKSTYAGNLSLDASALVCRLNNIDLVRAVSYFPRCYKG